VEEFVPPLGFSSGESVHCMSCCPVN